MWSPDGLRLATASKDKTVRIWSAESGEDPQVLRGHTAEVYTVTWSPDGLRLTPLVSVDEPKLWTATRHCIGVDRRIALLNVPEATAEAHEAACLRRVARGPE